jgi:hypothetical protein
MESKLVNLNVRLSEEEKSNLIDIAASNYMNMSDYIRHLVFNKNNHNAIMLIDDVIDIINKAIKEKETLNDPYMFIVTLSAIKELIK